MALYNFLVKNSKLLIWAFIGVMIFWGYNQAQERKIDARRIATLETTVTQMSNTVNQMAETMQQTAALMEKFNQMADSWEHQKAEIKSDQSREKASNEKIMQGSAVGSARIPDGVIDGLRRSADSARKASDSAVSANSAEPNR